MLQSELKRNKRRNINISYATVLGIFYDFLSLFVLFWVLLWNCKIIVHQFWHFIAIKTKWCQGLRCGWLSTSCAEPRSSFRGSGQFRNWNIDAVLILILFFYDNFEPSINGEFNKWKSIRDSNKQRETRAIQHCFMRIYDNGYVKHQNAITIHHRHCGWHTCLQAT